jgi:hypothetical protein
MLVVATNFHLSNVYQQTHLFRTDGVLIDYGVLFIEPLT